MTGDLYVQSVIDHVPEGLPLREQIAMELRSHIAERIAHGQTIEQVLRQLGDPLTLAESYLAAVPLQAAPVSAPNRGEGDRRRRCPERPGRGGCAAVGCASAGNWVTRTDGVSRRAVVGFVAYTVTAEYRTAERLASG